MCPRFAVPRSRGRGPKAGRTSVATAPRGELAGQGRIELLERCAGASTRSTIWARMRGSGCAPPRRAVSVHWMVESGLSSSEALASHRAAHDMPLCGCRRCPCAAPPSSPGAEHLQGLGPAFVEVPGRTASTGRSRRVTHGSSPDRARCRHCAEGCRTAACPAIRASVMTTRDLQLCRLPILREEKVICPACVATTARSSGRSQG
jgi:hypothetical protein